MSEPVKTAVDAVSAGTVIGTLAGWLPSIAALFTLIWTLLRLYEMPRVRHFLGMKTAQPTRECVETCPFFGRDDKLK